jgi:MFS family permease
LPLLLATLVWTMGEMVVFPTILSYISDLSEPETTPRNMGLFSASLNIGLILTPQLSLALTSAHGATAPWLAAGLVVGAALIVILLAHRNRYLWLQPPAAEATDVTVVENAPSSPT